MDDEAECNANCTGAGAPPFLGELQTNADAGAGNSLDCRIYHTSVAATYAVGDTNRLLHCGHGAWMPYSTSPGGFAYCVNSASSLGASLALVALLAVAALFL
jgi:hypothetical protein